MSNQAAPLVTRDRFQAARAPVCPGHPPAHSSGPHHPHASPNLRCLIWCLVRIWAFPGLLPAWTLTASCGCHWGLIEVHPFSSAARQQSSAPERASVILGIASVIWRTSLIKVGIILRMRASDHLICAQNRPPGWSCQPFPRQRCPTAPQDTQQRKPIDSTSYPSSHPMSSTRVRYSFDLVSSSSGPSS